MYKGTHDHEQRNATTRASSPVREYLSKYVNSNLTETQIKSLLKIDCPTASILPNQSIHSFSFPLLLSGRGCKRVRQTLPSISIFDRNNDIGPCKT